MAYNDSGELPKEQSQYDLGGYSFELKVQNVHEPGEPDVTSVFAICHSPDGSRETVPMDFPAGTTVDSWRVEATETEATVYATITNKENNPFDFPPFETVTITELQYSNTKYHVFSIPVEFIKTSSENGMTAASEFFTDDTQQGHIYNANNWTYAGKTVYWMWSGDNGRTSYPVYENLMSHGQPWELAWTMVYGSFDEEEEEVLVARFAIDIREADGGPDGDWDEPGDVGPDPEKYYTLTVSVTGASSGSNGGTPLEPGQVGGYGNGGTGGNGGGGGAGASTVIIYEFVTNKADNVVQEATAQSPGTGGPGGAGGKGGDGCILIFY